MVDITITTISEDFVELHVLAPELQAVSMYHLCRIFNNWFNELFAVSPCVGWYKCMHGLVFDTSI